MSLSRADSLAKLIYLAVQFIYTAKRPQDHQALYFRLAAEFLKAAPGAQALYRMHQQSNLNRRAV